MANPFAGLAADAKATTLAVPRARPTDPDALYKRLVTLAATSRDRAGFLRAHQQELAQLAPPARHIVVQSAGLGIPAEDVAKSLSSGSYLNTQIKKAAHDVIGIPGGLVRAGGAVAGDIGSTVHGKPTLKRTFGVAKQTGQGLVETVKHPGRDLFQTVTLASAAVSGAAGVAGRVGAVADVVKAAPAADLAGAVGKLSKADARAYDVLANPAKHLASVDQQTAARIATPSPQLGRVLDIDPHLAAERTAFVRRVGAKEIVPRKLAPAEKPAAAARAVGASKPAQVAKAAVKTPAPRQRTLTVPGEGGKPAIVVHPVASKNLAANLVERRVIDPLRQRSLDKGGAVSPALEAVNPAVARGAAQVGSATTKVGRELRVHRSVIDSLELAPVSRLERFHPSAPARGLTALTGGRVNVPTLLPRRLGGERLSAAEQKAIDIASADATPAQMVAYHTNLIGRGVGDRGAHELQIALTKAAAPHFERLMAGKSPHLEQALTETRQLIRKGEELKGLSPEEIAHRVGARAADIKAVAAGKASPLEEIQKIQDALEKQGARAPKPGERAAVEQKLAENAAAQQAYEKPGSRLVTGKQAQKRLSELDALYSKVLEPYTRQVMQALPYDNLAGETARRNVLRAEYDRQQAGVTRSGRPSGASSAKVRTRPLTLREEARKIAEQNVAKMIERNPSHPTVQRIKDMIAEREHLRRALDQEHPVFGEGKPVEKRVSTPPEARDATLAKLRRQESTLRTRLGELGQHERAQQIHDDLVREGFKAVENGAFYLPSRDKIARRTRVPATRQPGEYGLAAPGDNPALKHAFTGGLQRSGRQRSDATRLAAESYKQAQRYATIERGHRQLLAAARDTPEQAGGEFAIPIRTTVSVPEGLKRLVQKADVGTLTRQELKELGQPEVDAFVKALFPDPKEIADLKGVKWIDSRLLGGLRGQGNPFAGSAGSVLDTLNAPFRASLLYLKPAYALNLLQALGTNAIQQGVFTPVNLRAALQLAKTLGAEDQHAVFSLVGAGLSRSIEPTAGVAATAIHHAGEFWNKIVDRYPRVASWLHEARREGFNTPEKIHALVNDPRMQDKLVEVTRRANKEAIEYGQLSPFEQNVLRRAFFFYPWMRAATLYSLRFPKEHPVQAAVAAQLGAQGHQASVDAFGPFVDYGPGTAGLVPIGHGRGSNLTNLNTFSTPVELGEAIADPTQLPKQFGPIPAAIYTAVSHKTTLGGELPATSSPYGSALQSLLNVPAPLQLLHRAQKQPPADKVIKQPVFPKGPQAALERFVGGAVFPQPVNKQALAAKGEKAFVAKLNTEQKVKYSAAKTLQQAQADARNLHRRGILPAAGLPDSVRQALRLDRERAIEYAKAAKQAGVPLTSLPIADKAGVVAKIVAKEKTADETIIANFQRLVASTTDQQRQARIIAAFWKAYGRGGQLSAWRTYVSNHRETTADRTSR